MQPRPKPRGTRTNPTPTGTAPAPRRSPATTGAWGGAAGSGHRLHPATLPAGTLPLPPPPLGGGGGGGGSARSVSRSPSPTTARYPRADPYKPADGKVPAPGFTRKSSSDKTDVFF
ncbi:hypothetical protein DIPPA_03076 [Diplonema papillatum]|nr:hypothetical protein DIPPA_03076 [Diplonema papillatum]